jgi:Spy/CpxP family protein refolding chaperone
VCDTLLIVWTAQKSADDGEFVPRPPKESSPPKPHRPAPPAKVQLPKYFDQLDLTEEQLDKMSRVTQTYDAKIAELKQKLDAARKVRYGTTGVIIGLANAIKRVSNQRKQALEDLLTDEQREKLRQLRAGN